MTTAEEGMTALGHVRKEGAIEEMRQARPRRQEEEGVTVTEGRHDRCEEAGTADIESSGR